jgi:UPF0755 protein
VRSKPKLILSIVEGLATIALLAGVYFYTLTLPASTKGDLQEFEIAKGESIKVIANHLKDAKLIRSSLYFRYIAKSHKLILQAGKYQLFPSDSPLKLVTQLTKGLAVDKKITIPEGFRREQISELTGLNLVSPEGRLFPDTYFIKEDITAQELIDLMQANFAKKVGKVDEQTLILASLVERETKGDEEKPVVAGILKKRLDNGWPLELDATVQYFLGKPGDWWPNTTLLDRKIKSPYNTYLHPGLPPTPIGNPGLASLRAVQNSLDSPYWFYLHDKSGVIHYAATLADHNQNIVKYIK